MKKMHLVMAVMVMLTAACNRKSAETETQTPDVKVTTTRMDTLSVPLRAPAQLHGKQDIAIVPQVTATLEEVLVKEGDRVTQGQKMFVLNQTACQAAVDNALAGVASAEAAVQTQVLELDAKKQLLDKNIISQHEYRVQENRVMMARASLAEAQATLKHAQNNLSFTVIKAPHNGVVGTINYKQGALVGPTIPEPMTIVSDNSVVYAYTSISGDDYLYYINEYGSKENMLREMPDFALILGDKVTYKHPGRLETISGIIDAGTGAVSLRIAFPNPDGMLAAGGSGQVEVKYKDEGIALPRTAVFSIQDKYYVMVVEKGEGENECHVKQTMVEVYRLSDSEFIVTSGLTIGQQVVIEGVKRLANGDAIHPVEQ